MALLKIARMGHPVLFQVAEPVADPGAPDIRRLAADMIETMLDAPGVGLAAPQVHVPLRMFVLQIPPDRNGGKPVGPSVVINPRFTPLDDEMAMRWEGCLSIPGLRGAVPRHVRIRYTGVDCDGRAVGGEVDGLHANVVQHEYDHLDGVLYTMRMTDLRQLGFVEEITRVQEARAQEAGAQEAGA